MLLLLGIAPGERTAFRRAFTLSGVEIVLRMEWHPRTLRWLCTVESPSGEVLSLPQHASPGGSVVFDTRDPRLPSGLLLWSGPDDYARAALGDALKLHYYEPPSAPITDVPALMKLQS